MIMLNSKSVDISTLDINSKILDSLFNEFVCKLGSLWHEWAIKSPIYTRTS
jgi:hypothetical protein